MLAALVGACEGACRAGVDEVDGAWVFVCWVCVEVPEEPEPDAWLFAAVDGLVAVCACIVDVELPGVLEALPGAACA